MQDALHNFEGNANKLKFTLLVYSGFIHTKGGSFQNFREKPIIGTWYTNIRYNTQKQNNCCEVPVSNYSLFSPFFQQITYFFYIVLYLKITLSLHCCHYRLLFLEIILFIHSGKINGKNNL